MTAGDGYRYLLNSVVIGDRDRDAASALTRYYLESGTPPGSWIGSGLPGLSGGVAAGAAVTEEQLRRLMGFGQDPNSGEQLGRPYRKFATPAERVEHRLGKLSDTLTGEERAAQVALIEAEEAAKPTGAPVAGFDLTFSVPKSVSTLWAVADGGTQALIAQAHHTAIQDVIDLFERDVAMSQIGAKGPRGADRPGRGESCDRERIRPLRLASVGPGLRDEKTRSINATVVIDDPVSSLDQEILSSPVCGETSSTDRLRASRKTASTRSTSSEPATRTALTEPHTTVQR